MPIKLVCRCGRNLIVPEERAGRLLECPKCQHKMLVPGERRTRPIEEPTELASTTKAQVPVAPPPLSLAREAVAYTPAQRPAPPPLQDRPKPLPPPPLVVPKQAPLTVAPQPAKPPPLVVQIPPTRVATPPVIPVAPRPLPLPVAIAPPSVTAAAIANTEVASAPRRAGYQHDHEKLSAAYLLASLVVVLSLFGMVPGVLELVRAMNEVTGPSVGRFAYLLFFLGLVQIAYAVYLTQLPDWSSAWVLTGVVLMQAALYMTILTTIQLAQGQSPLVPLLDLHAHIDNGRVRAWCFIMLLLSGVVAYFCGSVSIRWRRAFVGVRSAYGS